MAVSVSIIIPTYNHRAYVLQTLESIFAQTFRDYEVIVVNDGSPDDTAQILRPWIEAGRIKYIEQPNAGQAAARNRGLAAAAGEFVVFLDDDDLIPSDRLEWQVLRIFHDVSIDGVVGGATKFDDHRHWDYVSTAPGPETYEDWFANSWLVSPGQALFRTVSIRRLGGFAIDIWGADDWDLYMRLAQVGHIKFDDKAALFYRVHSANASKNILRMSQNSRVVIRRNAPKIGKSKRQCIYTGHRYLFGYVGVALLDKCKDCLHARRAREALKYFVEVFAVWYPTFDFQLMKYAVYHLLPKRVTKKWSGLRHRCTHLAGRS